MSSTPGGMDAQVSTALFWDRIAKQILHERPSIPGPSGIVLPCLDVTVWNSYELIEWLESNHGYFITRLQLDMDYDQTLAGWILLLEKLSEVAPNIQTLGIRWRARGPWSPENEWTEGKPVFYGLGRDIRFVHVLASLKVKKSAEITGCYAKRWPEHLKQKFGDIVSDPDDQPGSASESMRMEYQKCTEHLDPKLETLGSLLSRQGYDLSGLS